MILQALGLTQKEADLYTILNENGPLSMSEIAQLSGITRSVLYKIIPKMVSKGFVQIVPKGKGKRYVAENPVLLESLLRDRQVLLEREISTLKQARKNQGRKPIVTFTSGSSAANDLYEDVIRTVGKGGMYYRYSSADASRKIAGIDPVSRKITESYKQQQIERYVITSEDNFGQKDADPLRSVKTIPSGVDLFNDDIAFLIYGTKVAIVDYVSGSVARIESKEIADFQKKLFKLLYSRL